MNWQPPAHGYWKHLMGSDCVRPIPASGANQFTSLLQLLYYSTLMHLLSMVCENLRRPPKHPFRSPAA